MSEYTVQRSHRFSNSISSKKLSFSSATICSMKNPGMTLSRTIKTNSRTNHSSSQHKMPQILFLYMFLLYTVQHIPNKYNTHHLGIDMKELLVGKASFKDSLM